MASLPGKTALIVFLTVGGAAALAADSPVGTVLLHADFEKDALGAPPAGFACFTDAGNTLAVAKFPGGGKAVRMTRTGGTVWKPMFSGAVSGESGSTVQLDFDWLVTARSDTDQHGLCVVLRGDGNRAVVRVTIRGPSGLAAQEGQRLWYRLHFPVTPNVKGHLTIVCDPLSFGSRGTYDVIISQNGERQRFPNLAFLPDWHGKFPAEQWNSPTFHIGGGRPDKPAVAWVDNVRLAVVPPRTAEHHL